MPEQVANLDFIAFSTSEVWQILLDRIAQRYKPALDEQHQRARRDRLGNRGHQKHRIRTHQRRAWSRGEPAEGSVQDDTAVPRDKDSRSPHTPRLYLRLDQAQRPFKLGLRHAEG